LIETAILGQATDFVGTKIIEVDDASTATAAATANRILDDSEVYTKFLLEEVPQYNGQSIPTASESFTVHLGFYGQGDYWTTDQTIAQNLGWQEVTITLTGDNAKTFDELWADADWADVVDAYTKEVLVTDTFAITDIDVSAISAPVLAGTGTVTTTNQGMIDASKTAIQVGNETNADTRFNAISLASAINHNSASQFWAMTQSTNSNGETVDMVYVFAKEGGNLNDLLACDVAASNDESRSALNYLLFENLETGETNQDGTTFSLGGQKWGTMKPIQTAASLGNQVWNVTLNGLDVGAERDLWIANAGEYTTPGLTDGIINGMDRNSFVEIQNAADGPWKGAEVRTQSAAQESLDAITEAINTKDKIRADLGALQNRLENTMTNLTIQAENLQASESRISDVDVATEMTEFTRNNVLAQAATSMLAQANSLSQLALSLIG
jgi:flagellin-like hook-associated protein FlgL